MVPAGGPESAEIHGDPKGEAGGFPEGDAAGLFWASGRERDHREGAGAVEGVNTALTSILAKKTNPVKVTQTSMNLWCWPFSILTPKSVFFRSLLYLEIFSNRFSPRSKKRSLRWTS